MKDNQTIRQKIEQLFGLPAMKMPWSLYLAQLNEAGKLTARSNMDMMTVILEVLEVMEEDIKDIKLMSEQPVQTISLEPIKVEPIVESPKEEPKTIAEKVSEVTKKVVDKGIVYTILESRPPEEKSQEPTA